MFGNLFDDEKPAGVMSYVHNLNVNVPCPPLPRHPCGFSGIANQGATCYLNSLLQTLLFTPEFREGLFQLSEQELGLIEDKDKGGKVRKIPLQLQRIFVRLLLVDQQSASTSELTDSFGWTNKEGLQQHDVQELNRILFSAIETSLVGTSGSDLISKLYHGSMVTEIVCQMCGKISEKEEDFFDLNVIVANFNILQESLNATFLQKETMKGKNQYRCSTCCNLVDAKKGLKIRCLPPILTLSLLRFSYDIGKGERYKETGRFIFPMEIDMSPYCDKQLEPENSIYELFSIVIHSGSSYGGHYHAYIRDVDCLGSWFTPVEEPVVIPSSSGNNWNEVDGPVELIKTLLSQQDDHFSPVDALCREISKCTGLSWNKRFKRSHGPFCKFLQKHNEVFYLNPVTSIVHLKDEPPTPVANDDVVLMESTPGTPQMLDTAQQSPSEARKSLLKNSLRLNFFDKKKLRSANSEFEQNWFDFNDSHVNPICFKDIEKQYSGKESAYMLFYRVKSFIRPSEAKNNPSYMMPMHLLELAELENEELRHQRELYESAINTITIYVHFSKHYLYKSGALQPKSEHANGSDVFIDKRKPLTSLLEQIQELYCRTMEVQVIPELRLFFAQDLPAGLHLTEQICATENVQSIAEAGILVGARIFVCDSVQIEGDNLVIGREFAPILLHFSTVLPSGEMTEISKGFPKFTTISEIKCSLCNLWDLPADDITVNRVELEGNNSKVLRINESQSSCSLLELGLVDGDNIILENCNKKEQMICDEGEHTLIVMIQNNCTTYSNGESTKCQIIEITIDFEKSVADLKQMILSKVPLDTSKQYILRKYVENRMKGPPLHESQTVKSSGLIDVKCVILEEGQPPTDEEVTLKFNLKGMAGDSPSIEMNLEKKMTIYQCLKIALQSADLKGDSWNLQKSNWCGEPTELLLHETLTLEEEEIHHGDFLYISSGRVPPKGYLSFTIWLYPTFENLQKSQIAMNGILNDYENLYRSIFNMVEHECGLVKLGDIEISSDSSIADIKKHVLTLPLLSRVSLPNVRFLRLRLIDGNRPGKVLRGLTDTLKKLKLQSQPSLCVQLLPFEEDLTQSDMILNISQRIPDSRTYTPPVEMTWDTTKSASPKCLKQIISDSLAIPIHRLVIAKHFSDKFQWLVIEENCNQKKSNKNRWSAKKQNLRYSPYFLRDGDTIGVKDQMSDPSELDDFNTQEDVEGQEILRIAAEGKRQRYSRKLARNSNGANDWIVGTDDTESSRLSKKSEIGITIHVDDFR